MDLSSGVICNLNTDRCSWNWEQPTVNQRLWTDVWLWDSPGTSRFWSTALWTPPDPVYQSRLSAAEVQELFADGLDLHTFIILSFLTNMSEFKPAAVLQTSCYYWLMGWQMTHWYVDAPTRSVVEGYVQQVDHVATRGEAEAAGLDVRSCGDKQSVHSLQVSWSSAECLQVTWLLRLVTTLLRIFCSSKAEISQSCRHKHRLQPNKHLCCNYYLYYEYCNC